MKFGFGLAIALLALSSPVAAETLTNRSIVALNASGLDADTIIAKIRTSDARFDLSTAQLVALKKQGVPSSVITAMIEADSRTKGGRSAMAPGPSAVSARPVEASSLAVARPAGIYLVSGGQVVRIDFNVSGQTKTSGLLGTMFTSGIAHTSIRTVLQGESARARTGEKTPTFYFYLPNAANRANLSSFEAQSSEPTSPNEFSLVRLIVKDGRREATVGRANIGGVRSGVMDKDRIDFRYDEVRPGVFSVRPASPLQPGEYSFVMIGAGGAKLARFFDFSVQP